MKKSEIVDKFWEEYLLWCVNQPEGSPSELLMWLKLKTPNENNFWKWFVDVKKGNTGGQV